MYQVNLGDNILYYPANETYAIYDAKLEEQVGSAGEFTFKVPPTNPLYSSLTQGALVTLLKDGAEYWRGEIKEITVDFAKVAEVYCLEDLAFLADEFVIPVSNNTQTFAQRFQGAIAAYNANRPAERQFAVGYVTNVDSSLTCNWITEYEDSILDAIRNCICGDSGYLRVRRVDNGGGNTTRYIDSVALSNYGVQATQTIEYGYNLLDFVKDSDYENLTNVLTPYGAETDTELYDGYNARIQGTTIQNADSVNAYGRHAKTVVFDNVDDVDKLNALASAYLTRYSQPQLTMEVKAVDLSTVENVSELNVGDSIRIISKPFAVDQWLYLTKIERDIQNIDKNTITLSGYVRTGRTLTSQAQEAAEAVKNIPSKSNILDAARRNALAILNGTEGGYVTFETNEDDQITELRIANNIDYEQSTKCWRWNLGGLAYLEREDPTDEWTVTTAATMDGGIVADFINSGSLTLGNGGSDAPLLQAYSGDTLVTRINRAGLYAIAGTIGGFTIGTSKLSRGDAQMTQYIIGCGSAGKGIVNLVGNQSSSPAKYGYIQISNSGTPSQCLDGIRIYGNGVIRYYDQNGNNTWARNFNNIPD
ncbi:MAG: phage tail protein [Clostridia bacterium]|nr:phage tail protein [Clostridia bacterium]